MHVRGKTTKTSPRGVGLMKKTKLAINMKRVCFIFRRTLGDFLPCIIGSHSSNRCISFDMFLQNRDLTDLRLNDAFGNRWKMENALHDCLQGARLRFSHHEHTCASDEPREGCQVLHGASPRPTFISANMSMPFTTST